MTRRGNNPLLHAPGQWNLMPLSNKGRIPPARSTICMLPFAPTDTDSAASSSSGSATSLAPDEGWLCDLDLEGFASELRALGKRLEAQQGQDDVQHLNKCAFGPMAALPWGS
jgi:hypothetical protein